MFNYIKADTIGEGIEASMKALLAYGEPQLRENQNKKEVVTEIQLCLDIIHPFTEPAISRAIPCTLEQLVQYDDEFLNGTADDLGWKYTYHQLYSKYYDQLINELNRDFSTRRACIALGQGDINFTSDPPCLQLLMFNVVNGRLDLTCVFRSNDGVKAFPMNIHAISMLLLKVATDLELPVGSLHYIANNFHCYNKDLKTLQGYCKTFESGSYARRFYSWQEYEKFAFPRKILYNIVNGGKNERETELN